MTGGDAKPAAKAGLGEPGTTGFVYPAYAALRRTWPAYDVFRLLVEKMIRSQILARH